MKGENEGCSGEGIRVWGWRWIGRDEERREQMEGERKEKHKWKKKN